jgi:protein-glutamine gamma-glutamyltransferase
MIAMLSEGSDRSETVTLAVAIRRYFEVALYLLVLTGFGTLASTGGLDFPTVVLVGAALLVRGYLLATRRNVIIPQRWTNYLTLVYLAFSVADYFRLSRNFLSALVHLVLFVMVVRLFSIQRERDHYVLSILSFLMVLAAAVLTVDSTFLLAFAGFVLMAVATFVLMEMLYSSRAATIHAKEVEQRHEYRTLAFSLVGTSPLLVFLILASGSLIFFMLPRVPARYFIAYSLSNDLSTGFSDRVQLGRIGQIQQSSAAVMHIQIDGDASGTYDLKWRGVALSLFDGRNWSTPMEHLPTRRLPDGTILLLLMPAEPGHQAIREEPAALAGRVIHYRVMMEPIGSNVFFLAPKATMLHGNYGRVTMDRAGAVYDLDPEHPVGRYEASSIIARPAAERLRGASESYPASVELADLQLPKVDARLPRLAEQITAAADNNYDKAVAIERYLMSNYGYTLELPRVSPADPLANFLFERKRGHCEYFASAMAIMLRTLRIPARVVNGFRTGEFNDLTSNYVVRASNAHSWVEVYFPDYGWVSFDPTPQAALPAPSSWNRMMLYMDAMASFWREWVIEYDSSHQKILGQEAARGSRALVDRMRVWGQVHYASLLKNARQMQRRMARSPRRWTIAGLLLTMLLLLLVNARQLLVLLHTFRLRAHPERAPRLAATIWYLRMTRTVARRGWRKLPVQTPVEFASAIGDAKLRERVVRFTRHYESARFGDSATDAGQLPDLYEEIAAARPK